ncbi:MAG TPA: tetratricopeptide repeat protein [Pyrinomonadaceae bacterium]
MTARFLLMIAGTVMCLLLGSAVGKAQVAPRAEGTRQQGEKQPVKPVFRKRVHTARVPSTSGSASEESDHFLDLGDQFAEKSKWNAAEAAYKEAVRIWSGNVDALLALGYLYVDKGTLSEAYSIYNRLRAMNSAAAGDLITEINRRKSEN